MATGRTTRDAHMRSGRCSQAPRLVFCRLRRWPSRGGLGRLAPPLAPPYSSPRSALQGQHQARLELRYEAGVGRQSSHKVRRAGRAAGRAATAQAAVADLCSQMQGSSRQSCHGVRVQRLLESEQVGLPQTLPTSRSSARRTWQPARPQVRGALCPAVHVEQPEVVAMGGEDCCVHLYDVSRAKREPGLLTQLQVRSAKWGSSVALLLAALLPDGKR